MPANSAPVVEVDPRIDDVLATLGLVADNEAMSRQLGERLAGLLLERSLRCLRDDYDDGRIPPLLFAAELASLAAQCRHAGFDAPDL